MIVSKKGCVAALKEAWKKGYEIVPYMGKISIYTENWALQTSARELPLEVSQTLVEHYGGIPTEPMLVQKGRDNQGMIGAVENSRAEELLLRQEDPTYMRRVPVTFKEKWDLFVTDDGAWMCVDRQYLDILEETRQVAVMITEEGMALFSLADEKLTVAPGSFGVEDHRKLQKIAEMYIQEKIYEVEVPENMSLFDDIGREDE